MQTLFTLSAAVKAAESKYAVVRAKAHDESLAPSTRAKYARQIGRVQRVMIESRARKAQFIAAQKARRIG